jgi:hypothetical protein
MGNGAARLASVLAPILDSTGVAREARKLRSASRLTRISLIIGLNRQLIRWRRWTLVVVWSSRAQRGAVDVIRRKIMQHGFSIFKTSTDARSAPARPPLPRRNIMQHRFSTFKTSTDARSAPPVTAGFRPSRPHVTRRDIMQHGPSIFKHVQNNGVSAVAFGWGRPWQTCQLASARKRL